MKIGQKTISLIAALAIILLSVSKLKLFHHYPDKNFGVGSYFYDPTELDSLSPYLIDLLIYLIFIINYSSEGVAITRSFFENDYYILILAILCYLIYTAFKKAMILKEESELTI